ncbi:lysophospholipid acyltransferase family protein [Lutibacter sp. A64]|uniref:lysophospholipid acyltransferase family protein n=1 Tax=Lutibacter sp. A64 TaxID=2918526 RepID=UPI001F069906|nr:lysophospholipid acyltransferase family protein [Lutibacter sp. A64]UMB54954.1 lysophospholipid acyltransferase family protein [Lutibacter sp. A64]
MNLLVYILVYPIIWLLSILPFKILYFISDIIYLLVYYVIGYRKKVVFYNLKLTFPQKTDKELIKLRKLFYHHFVDIFIEMIKSFTVSKKEIYKRYQYTNLNFFTDLYKDGKSVVLVGPHYANWEWIMSLDSFVKYKGYAAYTKINNPYFNNQILKSRTKFGTSLVQTSKVISEIKKNQKNNVQAIYGLLSDQSPQLKKTFYWSEFLGIKVPIHTGAEMLAKRYDLNVVYMDVQRIKRGYYQTTFSLITDNATKFEDYQITDIFLEKVEKQIRINPEFYFWTHKRFKHKDKAPKEDS